VFADRAPAERIVPENTTGSPTFIPVIEATVILLEAAIVALAVVVTLLGLNASVNGCRIYD
jgi:hypothetical protein